MNSNLNILGLFVKIIDAKKCINDLAQDKSTNFYWPNQQIRNLANNDEWSRYKYTPERGNIGEVVAKMEIPNHIENIYIIRTFGMFYVPIFESGFEGIEVKQSVII